ncbi:MAG: epoxyqueuosine reductase [Lachnospiraceae bacterium]|nr:epoxyqueuosine reductase [Lachnospiraceae bacterium]
MKKKFENVIWNLMEQYCQEKTVPNMWEKPVVKFASASDSKFFELREVVVPEHYVPTDYLKDAVTVLSYFLPFKREIPQTNVEGFGCSEVWANSYLITNDMFGYINEHLVTAIREMGFDAAVPHDAGMISMEVPKSRWSQRHVAYIAGHGTFGLNNMLISDKGSAGRYNSIVTTIPVEADAVPTEERCLYKKNGSCGLCVKRCMTGALTVDGFDRFKCLEMCLENEKKYPGADVCGKCVVELPCSHMESTVV